MLKFLFKVRLALQNNKMIYYDKYFILSYDIVRNIYIVWFVGTFNSLNIYSILDSPAEAKFKWKILMNKERK